VRHRSANSTVIKKTDRTQSAGITTWIRTLQDTNHKQEGNQSRVKYVFITKECKGLYQYAEYL
jgi:hypothetical protein